MKIIAFYSQHDLSAIVLMIDLTGFLTAARKIQLCFTVTHGIYQEFSRKHRPEPWCILVHMQQLQNRSTHNLHHYHKSRRHEHKLHRKESGLPVGERNGATVHLQFSFQTSKTERSLEIWELSWVGTRLFLRLAKSQTIIIGLKLLKVFSTFRIFYDRKK